MPFKSPRQKWSSERNFNRFMLRGIISRLRKMSSNSTINAEYEQDFYTFAANKLKAIDDNWEFMSNPHPPLRGKNPQSKKETT